MDIPYLEAIDILGKVAVSPSSTFSHDGDTVPISRAAGRICRQSCFSPISTPTFDSSAMDGFAICSFSTVNASPSNPITLCVKATLAAGDAPLRISNSVIDGCPPCVEIMTGAQFPNSGLKEPSFDACIKVEDTVVVRGPDAEARYIKIIKPAQPSQNRRSAGSDFEVEDLVIAPGTTVQPHHVMALAALGIKEISVFRKLRVGIMSTGSELLSYEDSEDRGKDLIRDCNAPYLETVLSGLGVEVTNFGIVKDSSVEFQIGLSQRLLDEPYDMVVTTGAVSMGKFDFVRAGIAAMGAEVHFHRVAIRPGHPVLFATIPHRSKLHKNRARNITPPFFPLDDNSNVSRSNVTFFGLPGNPIAAAVCLRFLVIPYLRSLHAVPPLDKPMPAVLCYHPTASRGTLTKPFNLQAFWHGKHCAERGEVTISSDQGPNKLRPLLSANCWVGIPSQRGILKSGDVVEAFEMYPPSLGLQQL